MATDRAHPTAEPSTDAEALHPYVELLFRHDPILASVQGDDRGHDRLGDIEPDAFAARDHSSDLHGDVLWLES